MAAVRCQRVTQSTRAQTASITWVILVTWRHKNPSLARAIKERLPHMKDLKPENVCQDVSNAWN
jgi:hypothetical protein